jgi:hypothetical protein
MSDKNLDLGLIEIMPNTIKVEYYIDLKKEVEKLGEGWVLSKYEISRYLFSMTKELKIREYIMGKYSYELISQIEVIIDDDHRGKTYIIDDDDDIKNFINGEEAICYDEDGEENEVRKDSSRVIDYEIGKGRYFVYRKK